MKSEIEFTIKNRFHDLIGKLLSVKIVWATIVTVIFIISAKITAQEWLIFLGAVLGLASADKVINKFGNGKSTTVGTEPDA